MGFPGIQMAVPSELRTVKFGSTAKVLAKCKLTYYRISECSGSVIAWQVMCDDGNHSMPMSTIIIPGTGRKGSCSYERCAEANSKKVARLADVSNAPHDQ